MVRVHDVHTHLIGKLCKPTALCVPLEREYERLFGLGSVHAKENLFFFCHRDGPYEVWLIFIDEPPETRDGLTWYVVKEVGEGVMGDWHYVTMNQVMICES